MVIVWAPFIYSRQSVHCSKDAGSEKGRLSDNQIENALQEWSIVVPCRLAISIFFPPTLTTGELQIESIVHDDEQMFLAYCQSSLDCPTARCYAHLAEAPFRSDYSAKMHNKASRASSVSKLKITRKRYMWNQIKYAIQMKGSASFLGSPHRVYICRNSHWKTRICWAETCVHGRACGRRFAMLGCVE